MSRPAFTAKIDVTKIKKEFLYTSEKTGAKYLDIAIWENRDGTGRFGDTHFITQSLSKAAREAGGKGEILGDMKPTEVFQDQGRQANRYQDQRPAGGKSQGRQAPADDDVPF